MDPLKLPILTSYKFVGSDRGGHLHTLLAGKLFNTYGFATKRNLAPNGVNADDGVL